MLTDITRYRSQARLERLGDQLGSDARAAAEDDISINVLSDEETLGNLLMSPKNDKVSPRKDEMPENRLMGPRKDQYKASPSKKRMRVPMGEADEKSKQGIFYIICWITNIHELFC